MDKTLADMFTNALFQDKLLTEMTMYGVYFIPSEDKCTVIKAEVKIGEATKIFMGKETLTITDAINRVFTLFE